MTMGRGDVKIILMSYSNFVFFFFLFVGERLCSGGRCCGAVVGIFELYSMYTHD